MNTRVHTQRRQAGFTLIELIVAIAILGVLAAVAVPAVLQFVDKGSTAALDADTQKLQHAVDAFQSEKHKGVSGGFWGNSTLPAARFYPTKDGLIPSLELGTGTDSNFTDRSNTRINVFAAGSQTFGAFATDTNIKNGAVWIGLLVNEPESGTTDNDKPGLVHPRTGEKGQFLRGFPASSSEDNTDTDTTSGNANGKTSGTYTWVILKDPNSKVVPAYKGADGNWYTGFNNAFP